METVRYLVIGAGMSGLAFADAVRDSDVLVLEATSEIGGYCKTIRREGFTWDYSGHFFHFRHPEIERELVSRMAEQKILRVKKDSRIRWQDGYVDFPFQKNIHQLPREDFLDCLVDLHFREKRDFDSFRDMLYVKFGRSIAEKFLVPYNEKLYATDLARLDPDAMGRFFPYADEDEILRNFRRSDNASYNDTFTYPEGGAIEYVKAMASELDPSRIALDEPLLAVDLSRREAKTTKRTIRFEHLVSTMPFDRLLRTAQVDFDASVYTYNKVEVFNLGFDSKGPDGVHWIYYPQRDLCFYRVGFYDNIFATDRMSLYVEIGRKPGERADETTRQATLENVLTDLRRAGVVSQQTLVAHHHIVMDPAYVHITRESIEDVRRHKAALAESGVHSIGRYGSWTYCSIEDNVVEARALAAELRQRA